MTRPWLTTEFWVMIATVIVSSVGWIDFPTEALAVIISWILGRSLLKFKSTSASTEK